MEIPVTVNTHRRIILLDGVCNLCAGFFRFVARRDRSGLFRFCWVQSAQGLEILRWAGLSVDAFETMLYVEEGVPYQQSDAVLRVVRQLPFPWSLLSVGLVVPRPLRNWLYMLVSRNRYRLFGRQKECFQPVDDLRQKLL